MLSHTIQMGSATNWCPQCTAALLCPSVVWYFISSSSTPVIDFIIPTSSGWWSRPHWLQFSSTGSDLRVPSAAPPIAQRPNQGRISRNLSSVLLAPPPTYQPPYSALGPAIQVITICNWQIGNGQTTIAQTGNSRPDLTQPLHIKQPPLEAPVEFLVLKSQISNYRTGWITDRPHFNLSTASPRYLPKRLGIILSAVCLS